MTSHRHLPQVDKKHTSIKAPKMNQGLSHAYDEFSPRTSRNETERNVLQNDLKSFIPSEAERVTKAPNFAYCLSGFSFLYFFHVFFTRGAKMEIDIN